MDIKEVGQRLSDKSNALARNRSMEPMASNRCSPASSSLPPSGASPRRAPSLSRGRHSFSSTLKCPATANRAFSPVSEPEVSRERRDSCEAARR